MDGKEDHGEKSEVVQIYEGGGKKDTWIDRKVDAVTKKETESEREDQLERQIRVIDRPYTVYRNCGDEDGGRYEQDNMEERDQLLFR